MCLDLSISEWLDVENTFFFLCFIFDFNFLKKEKEKKNGFVTHRTLQENTFSWFQTCVYLCRPGQTLCQQKKHGSGKVSVIFLVSKRNMAAAKLASYFWTVTI